jgi:hypothetical protein
LTTPARYSALCTTSSPPRPLATGVPAAAGRGAHAAPPGEVPAVYLDDRDGAALSLIN